MHGMLTGVRADYRAAQVVDTDDEEDRYIPAQ